jgi:5-methylcytosine-specific restriction endonuclease McrA
LQVFARDRWRCQLCGVQTPRKYSGQTRGDAPELDHIVPFAAGGAHVLENVQCACRRCNLRKMTRPMGQLHLALQ